ncbi:uncharacterized protein LOC142608991 [Castanea sativa]|uniref:uncharacterized protein LOC142608991 n=1 Tax=Castanea sativa TaxID=21020 RepID=UPI003F64EB14
MWLGDKGCGETMEGVWQVRYEEEGNTRVIKKVENCGKAQTKWSRDCFGNITKELKKKRRELTRAEKMVLQGVGTGRLFELKKEINSLMDKEERMWRQRSHTLYFKDEDQIVAANLDSILRVATAEMNESLTGTFHTWEVELTLKQMASLKVSGPDEMPPLFYQNFWELVKDDRLLFCRATTHDCQKVMEIFMSYEKVSGQKLNRDKTTLFFSKSTPREMQRQIMGALGVTELKQYEEYLGLPAMVGRNKRASFDQLKQRVWMKLQGWEGKLLSQAGREVLIKSVIQAIPTFTMSCFKLPITLCHEIESLIRKFWWGQRGDRRKIHWVRWEDMCQHKDQGGMGFKGLTMFNEAMLAKLAWRLLHDDNSLFYRVFKARFFPRGSILEAKDSSSAWKSILKGREVILKGALWKVGDGKKIRIWGDNWLPSKSSAKITTPVLFGQENSNVEVLINPVTRRWRIKVVDHVFNEQEAETIKNIPLSSINHVLVWPFTPLGNYSIKSGYRFQHERSAQPQRAAQDSTFWKNLWGLEVMWNADPQWRWLSEMKGSSIKDIFKRGFAKRKDVALLAFTGWAVWNGQNQIFLKEATCPLNQIHALSKDRKYEFQLLHPVVGTPQHRNHTGWKPPDQGLYKVNYDVAIFPQQEKSGVGVVIRNEEGAVMASMLQ